MPFIEHNGKRVLFIHIPKAGGTSIEAWMKDIAPLRLFSIGVPLASRCTPQHLRAQDIRALLGENYFDLMITVVRNPYDRIASEYRMQTEIARQGFWKSAIDFSPWLETHLTRQMTERFHLDNHLRPQWEFLGKGVEVFRLEDGLAPVLARMAGVLGVPAPEAPPHELRSKGEAVKWDMPDRIRVQTHYAKDFETFNYPI